MTYLALGAQQIRISRLSLLQQGVVARVGPTVGEHGREDGGGLVGDFLRADVLGEQVLFSSHDLHERVREVDVGAHDAVHGVAVGR